MRLLWRSGIAAASLLVLFGCGDDGAESPPGDDQPVVPCEAPSRQVGERCVEPGVQDDGCAAGTLLAADGACALPGVPPERCGDGFEPDGRLGCNPILPPDPCPAGWMAVPGESSCREVAPCGSGAWGDIPIDGATVFVDQAYAGAAGPSDGSELRPFVTIGEAVSAASAGALVAIGPGSYEEDVVLAGRPLRLWGKCPAEVEVVGGPSGYAAVFVSEQASGSEVRGLALRSESWGLIVSGSEAVLVEDVWIHHTSARGVEVADVLGPTSAELRNVLVEAAHYAGIAVVGAVAELDAVVLRGSLPDSVPAESYGVVVQVNPATAAPSSAIIRRSVLEDNVSAGMFVVGASAVAAGNVVRNNGLVAGGPDGGDGILVQADPLGEHRTTLALRTSLLDHNGSQGLLTLGSDVTIEDSVVRGTQAVGDVALVGGLSVQSDLNGPQERPGRLTARRTVIDSNAQVGVYVSGGDVTLEGVWVHNTQPNLEGRFGRGVSVQDNPVSLRQSVVTIRGSLLEHNHEAGLVAGGSVVTLDGVLVRATQPELATQGAGFGIGIQVNHQTGTTSGAAIIVGSAVEQNHQTGVMVTSAEAEITGLLVRDTAARPLDDLLGDGVDVVNYAAVPAGVSLRHSLVEGSARVGVAIFGAPLAIGASTLRCNGIPLAAEVYDGMAAQPADLGGNRCGCDGAFDECRAVSAGVEPPAPIQ